MQSKLSRAVLTGALASGLVAGTMAALPAVADSGEGGETTSIEIYTFNDFHGALSNEYSGTLFAHTVEEQRAEFEAEHGEGTTLLTSAGDLIGASASVSNVQQDEPTLEIMNALGLAASAAGNHEFDKGLDDLRERVPAIADFEFLAANFVDPETKEPVLPAYEMHEVDGVRVAVIGAVPNNLYATTTGAGLQGNEVIDLVEGVNTVAAELEANDEADVIVASYHDGSPVGGSTPLEEATAGSEVFDSIVNGTDPAVDVIFNGHTHQTYLYQTSVEGIERPVLQTGQSGNTLGAVELTLDADTHEVLSYEAELVDRVAAENAEGTFDPEAFEELIGEFSDVTTKVYDVEQAAVEEFEELQGTVIGEIDASITTDYQTRIKEDGAWRAGGTRRQESTLGNWAANALKDRVSLSHEDVDLGVTNSGGLRAELLFDRFTGGGSFPEKDAALHGKVTLGEVLDLAPFGNTLVYFDLPGSSIKQVLEENWQEGKKALHLGWSEELTYTYDESRAQDDKVTGIWINGEPVDMDEMYTIATLSFLGDTSWVGTGNSAPDGYEGFAIGQENYVDLGIMDNQAFQEYIEAETVASGDIRPDFAKKAVEVTGAPESLAAGDPVELTLENLEMDSDGAGDATRVFVAYQGAGGEPVELGEVAIPAEGESVEISGILLPENLPAGQGELVFTVHYDDEYTTTTEVRVALTQDSTGPEEPSEPSEPSDPADPSVPAFSDNRPGSAFFVPVQWMAANGISVGYADGTFKKTRDVTRGESAAFLHRYADPEFAAPSTSPFSDVNAGGANFTPISWAAAEQITAGFADGTFKPSTSVTRGQFAAFLYGLRDREHAAPQTSPFSDLNPGGANYAAITWLAEQGITVGDSRGDFNQSEPITRGQISALLQRYDQLPAQD